MRRSIRDRQPYASSISWRNWNTLYTDSQYLVNAINQKWLENWKKRGWKKADKSPVLNQDLWEALDAQLSRHQVTFVWVKGHADNPYNNRCDELAVAQTQKHK